MQHGRCYVKCHRLQQSASSTPHAVHRSKVHSTKTHRADSSQLIAAVVRVLSDTKNNLKKITTFFRSFSCPLTQRNETNVISSVFFRIPFILVPGSMQYCKPLLSSWHFIATFIVGKKCHKQMRKKNHVGPQQVNRNQESCLERLILVWYAIVYWVRVALGLRIVGQRGWVTHG